MKTLYQVLFSGLPGEVFHVEEGISIPNCTDLAPDCEYPVWRDGGWVSDKSVYDAIEAEKARAAIPAVVSMRQARLALLNAGLLDDVESAIAAMTGTEGRAAQIEWEYATEVRRDAAMIAAVQAATGMDGGMIDELFIRAAAL